MDQITSKVQICYSSTELYILYKWIAINSHDDYIDITTACNNPRQKKKYTRVGHYI